MVSFVSWQQLPGGYPSDLKVTDSTPPPGTVRSAGILTVKVKLENLGAGGMVVHSKFLNTPDSNDALLEGVTLTVADAKFNEPAHDQTSQIDEGSRFFVPTNTASASGPFDFVRSVWNGLTGPKPTDTTPVGAVPDEANKKVTLCHMTGSAKNPGVTITVSQNAVDAHMAHGDHLGLCDTSQPADKGKPADTGKPTPQK